MVENLFLGNGRTAPFFRMILREAELCPERKRPFLMYQLLHTLIEKCEVGLHKDATGWHFSAKGGLGVITLLIVVLLLRHVL